MLLVVSWYLHTKLSKVQVNVIFSNINKVLVKDWVSYALRNLQEITIM